MKTEMLMKEKVLRDNGFGFPNTNGRRPSRKQPHLKNFKKVNKEMTLLKTTN